MIPKLIVLELTGMLDGMHARFSKGLHGHGSVATLLLESEETEALRRRLGDAMTTSTKCIAAIDDALAQ